jgi:hypothetical protein
MSQKIHCDTLGALERFRFKMNKFLVLIEMG